MEQEKGGRDSAPVEATSSVSFALLGAWLLILKPNSLISQHLAWAYRDG